MAFPNPFSIKNHLFLSSSLWLLLCYLEGAYVDADRPYHVVNVNSLLPGSNCTASTPGSKFGSQKLQVRYRHGACSPTGTGNKSPDSAQILSRDSLRVSSINSKTSGLYDTKETNVKTQELAIAGGGDYVVTIGFGTPRQDRTVIIDTGSDITWVQCKSCSSCHPLNESLFDPSKSTSYSNGSCNPTVGNFYKIDYKDNSYSSGSYGCDTLTLEPSIVIQNFQFGCSQEISSASDFADSSGLLGLGLGKEHPSFVSQTASKFGKVFSYCLPAKDGSTGYLLFGDEAKSLSSSSSLKFTPLVKGPSPSLYFLQLLGITVGSKQLEISPSTFSRRGTIIDSGTVITRLPESAYKALQSEFQRWMKKKYPRARAPPEEKILNTCFNLSGHKTVEYPNIIFHLGGGTDVNLDQSGIVWAKHPEQVCLAFAAKDKDDDYTIIGNHQQKALDVFYDIQEGRLGFGTNGCHN
ncbi:hypothetical protein F0562_007518 [Nyssa sinensis]|uniref:Peptidase A1 domain-containing protein n=1 Tax=Nyssa sinensis TaxID=561372 RepID=A0A5J5A8F5_9ASTE|nr:hypothetical protein F0562_007518 [Nyssa sinensis]